MADIITTGNRSDWKTQARIKLTGRDDSTLLPDATLTSFVEEAERNIKKKVTDWATIIATASDNKENLIDAAIAYLCGILVRPLRAVIAKVEKAGDMQDTYDIDFNVLEESLIAQVESYLSNITTYTAQVVTRVGVITNTAIWESLS